MIPVIKSLHHFPPMMQKSNLCVNQCLLKVTSLVLFQLNRKARPYCSVGNFDHCMLIIIIFLFLSLSLVSFSSSFFHSLSLSVSQSPLHLFSSLPISLNLSFTSFSLSPSLSFLFSALSPSLRAFDLIMLCTNH